MEEAFLLEIIKKFVGVGSRAGPGALANSSVEPNLVSA